MPLDPDHARAVLATYLDAPDPAAFAERARASALGSIDIEAGNIDIDVPIPLVLKIDGFYRLRIDGLPLLVELWGEAYDRDYGARLTLQTDPEDVLYASPPLALPPEPERWSAGVERLSEVVGHPIDPTRFCELLASLWPGPLAEIWTVLVARY